MTQIAVDLHMHSALSPCGDKEMTPNNIVGMSMLKALNVIAVTDHNSAKNVPAVAKAAKGLGLQILPGIEVTTKEECHILAYTPDIESVLALDTILYKHLPMVKNRPDYFGHQYIMDEEDEIVGEVDKLLISATDLSVEALKTIVDEMNGIIVPAHIDRKSYSIMASLGFIPMDLKIRTVEISRGMSLKKARESLPVSPEIQMIQGSDAHYLEDIAEREYFLDVPDLKRDTLLKYLGYFR